MVKLLQPEQRKPEVVKTTVINSVKRRRHTFYNNKRPTKKLKE